LHLKNERTKTDYQMKKKALLLILDGWGEGNKTKADVIASTPTPYWDSLLAQYPHSHLLTDGVNVGLPAGQMGNSEVGHMNIGAGRVIYQDLVKINMACEDNSIMQNPEIKAAFEYAKNNGKQVHFMGLVFHWRCSLFFRPRIQIARYSQSLWH
jgi:Phosphoglyceromutase